MKFLYFTVLFFMKFL